MIESLTHSLTIAYMVMGGVALFAYLPQMFAFWTKPEVCAVTPLLTWSLWSCQTVVFFLYAVIANGDPMFMFNSGMFMCATITCLLMILRGRKMLQERANLPSNVVQLRVA
ncbi:MAG: hypothetical protein DI585_04875 [Pseudomonas fluorescens]|nr:MAG: hypothetical protein DI585_04875 [Pseudomonas fluorescens]